MNPTNVLYANDYAMFTETTAVFPRQFDELPMDATPARLYLVLGLCDEVGEFASAALEAERVDELGDVQWYVARLCDEFIELPYFEGLVAAAADTTRGSAETSAVLFQLTYNAGRAAGVLKKIMRDGRQWTPEKFAEKIEVLKLALLHIVCASYDFAQARVPGGYEGLLSINRAKLEARKAANKLHGDGGAR